MSGWNWLKDGVGGGIDFLTGGFTDFDQKGNDIRWGQTGSPIFGGSDGKWGPEPEPFSFGDAMDAFTKGYASTMGGGGATPGGSSFLNAYTSGKGATPTTSSPVSTSSAFTAGGQTHSMPGIVIDKPVDFYAFKNEPEYPAGAYMGAGGSTAKKPNRFAGAVSGALGGFQAGGIPGAILGGIGGLFCDERVKVDISPLITTEVNDELAQAAFFVKELRECS